MNANTEPVAAASAVTIVAGGLVAIGQITHVYTMTPDQAVAVVGAVFVATSAVTSWWARRKVTPIAPPVPPVPPKAP